MGRREGLYGTRGETYAEKHNVGIDGLGEPAWVIELRATDDSYWYAKQRRVIGMKALNSWYEENYDNKGEVIRLRRMVRGLVADDVRMTNAEGRLRRPGGKFVPDLMGLS